MKQLLLYAFTLLFTTFIGGWLSILALPIGLLVKKLRISNMWKSFIIYFFPAALLTFLFSLLYDFLDVEFGILSISIICFGYILFRLQRVGKGRNKEIEFGSLFGEITGVIFFYALF